MRHLPFAGNVWQIRGLKARMPFDRGRQSSLRLPMGRCTWQNASAWKRHLFGRFASSANNILYCFGGIFHGRSLFMSQATLLLRQHFVQGLALRLGCRGPCLDVWAWVHGLTSDHRWSSKGDATWHMTWGLTISNTYPIEICAWFLSLRLGSSLIPKLHHSKYLHQSG